jgi:hypothetical protein
MVNVCEPLINVVKLYRAKGNLLYRALAKMACDRLFACLVRTRWHEITGEIAEPSQLLLLVWNAVNPTRRPASPADKVARKGF